MVNSDRWRKRPAVMRYWQWKDRLRAELDRVGCTLPDSYSVTFCVAMPASWSKRKRADHDGQPHQVRPDCDNYTKALQDAALAEDSRIWWVSMKKVWAYTPAIVIERIGT